MSTVSFHTLGCKLNYAETGTITRDFIAHDFRVVPFGQPADVTVINTCSVTDEADKKCRKIIRRARRASTDGFLVVTGCYAQLRPDDVAAIPGVDAVLGTSEKFSIFELLQTFSRPEQTQILVSCIDDAETFGPAYSTGERTRAFLKIQDGCDYSCSFCTIPTARGRSRSQSISSTIEQARVIADQGVREVVLSGVNIGLFGNDRGESLLDLLRQLDKVKGIDRFRISSIEPNLLTDPIIDFVAGSQRFAPHFHVPLQSGDDFVLGKMRRRYKAAAYRDRIHRVKSAMPEAGIGVDVIVGFPAETDRRFENTVRFLEDLPASYLHVFTYSERAGTHAVDRLEAIATSPVSPHERSRRNRILRLLSEKKRKRFYKENLGSKRNVLWEGKVLRGRLFGFTENYIKVSAPAEDVVEGTVERVTLDRLDTDGTMRVLPGAYVPIV